MHKKIQFVLVLVLLLSCNFGAYSMEKYKILFLNTDKIMIGNRWCHIGDTILDSHKIVWTDKKQAMKVVNLRNSKQRVLVPNKDMLKLKLSISDLLTSSRNLSVREGEVLSISQLKEELGKEIVLCDSFCIKVSIQTDDSHYFFLSYIYQKELIFKKLPLVSGCFIIDRSIFNIDGVPIKPFSTPIKIYYQNYDSRQLITDECMLKVVALKL